MKILPRLDGNVLKFFNADTGANHRTVQLPTNATYSGLIVSSDTVSVTIHFKNSNDVIRTYNLNNGRLIRSISM
jgi:hypothetical protein